MAPKQNQKLVAAETLEEAVPGLEMQFLGLTNQPAATQQQEAPALVSKLQALLDAGFVEVTATLESAKSLLV